MGLSCLLLLSLIASAAVSTFAAQSDPAPPVCDLSTVAPKLARHCQSDPDVPSFLLSSTAQCCEALVGSLPAQEEMALSCLCRVVAEPEPPLITAKLDANRLFALYRGCGKGNVGSPSFGSWYCQVEKTGDIPTAACDAANIATLVSRFCMIDKRPADCCMAVVAAVGLTGIPPCLCRVAAEPQLAATGLNVTGILALYAGVCRGRQPVGPHLADGCKGWHLPAPVTTAAVLPRPRATMAASASCKPEALSRLMVLYVYKDRTVQSCKDLVASVDLGGGVPCLCRTGVEYVTISAGLKATDLLAIYNACGGLRLGGADHKAAAASCEGYGLPPPTPTQEHGGDAIHIGPDTLPETATA